jgi:hypothetical protein
MSYLTKWATRQTGVNPRGPTYRRSEWCARTRTDGSLARKSNRGRLKRPAAVHLPGGWSRLATAADPHSSGNIRPKRFKVPSALRCRAPSSMRLRCRAPSTVFVGSVPPELGEEQRSVAAAAGRMVGGGLQPLAASAESPYRSVSASRMGASHFALTLCRLASNRNHPLVPVRD